MGDEVTDDELRAATIAAIRIVEARGQGKSRDVYTLIASQLDDEICGRRNWTPSRDRGRPIVEPGNTTTSVMVHAFGRSLEVKYRDQPTDERAVRRTRIAATLGDLVSKLLYYDRKEDSTLPVGAIEAAIAAGEITADEIIGHFATELRKGIA